MASVDAKSAVAKRDLDTWSLLQFVCETAALRRAETDYRMAGGALLS
jgi:hypothetical protein